MSPVRRRRRRGKLVALEGIDGAGKSTLASALVSGLRRRGLSAVARREPSDPKLGALAQSVSQEDAWTSAVYFTVDRYLARPALERALAKHDVVVSDRSFYSTLAYQGSSLSPREQRRLRELERTATIAPDLVILLEIDPMAGLRRAGRRGSDRGPLEQRRVLTRVARAYRALSRESRWVVLDANRPRAELLALAMDRIVPRSSPRRRGAPARRR
jgi:dTMP kinase